MRNGIVLGSTVSGGRSRNVSPLRDENRGPMAGEGRRGIKAVEVAGRILDHLARAQTSVGLRDLAAAGRMSPGKVHRYLASFLASGLARQDPDTRQYALGPLAMRLGLAALNSYQPLRDAITEAQAQNSYEDQIADLR